MRLLALLLLLAGAAAPVAAQTVRFAPDPPAQFVTDMMANARGDLPRVTGDAGLPGESLLDRSQALLTIDEARAVIDVGMASGFARWCSVDWRPNLDNLLAEARASGTRNERQIAYIGVLHAHAMRFAIDANSGRRCARNDRTMIEEFMRQRWTPAR